MNMPRSAPLMRLALVLATLCLALTGCKGACRQLSEKLCDCALNSTEKSACIARAGNSEGANPSNEVAETYCRAHLQSCDCRLIDTTQGKLRCGLAREAPQ